MNANAAAWTPIEFEDDDNIDDFFNEIVPVSGAVSIRHDTIRSSRRSIVSISPLERGLEACAEKDGSTIIVEDDAPGGFYELESAGMIDILELVVSRADHAPTTQKRARLELKIRRPANNNRGFR